MMKYLLILAAFLPLSLFAQEEPAKTSHSEVVEVAGATAKVLSERASSFLTAKKAEPRTTGNLISGTGLFTVTYPSIKKGNENGNIKFSVKITVKDGKYKMDLTDFRHVGIMGKSSGGSIDLAKPECGESQISNEGWATAKAATQVQIKAFVAELKKNLGNPVKAAAPSTDF